MYFLSNLRHTYFLWCFIPQVQMKFGLTIKIKNIIFQDLLFFQLWNQSSLLFRNSRWKDKPKSKELYSIFANISLQCGLAFWGSWYVEFCCRHVQCRPFCAIVPLSSRLMIGRHEKRLSLVRRPTETLAQQLCIQDLRFWWRHKIGD